ncbi:hypothetical protein ACEPAI_5511 [Sanghuangporus weigelae]
MPTYPDVHYVWQATSTPPNDGSESLWPDKMLRTYLWALAVQSESSSFGYESNTCCDYDHSSFGTYSSVRVNTDRYSFGLWDEMAQNPLSDVDHSSDKLFGPSQGTPLLREQSQRRAAKSYTHLRPTLPDSPRNPRLVRSRSPSPSSKTEYLVNSVRGVPRLAETMELVRNNDVGGRKAPPKCQTMSNPSRPPAIVLSPSSPDSGSQSFTSTSSASEFPSAPESTTSDGCTSTSSNSTQVSKIGDHLVKVAYPRILSMMRRRHSEDDDAPVLTISEAQFKLARQSQVDQLVITIDLSECTSMLRPGKHGWVFPHVFALNNTLTSHARYARDGSHVFTRQREGAQFRYVYCGYYKIASGVKWGLRPRKIESQELERKDVFFLEFVALERQMLSIVTALATPVDEQKLSLERSTFSVEVKRKTSRPHVRTVNVDGVDFEIASTPVAWDHGSFRE